jgi:tetratricopeptide (TPR) repeat protein
MIKLKEIIGQLDEEAYSALESDFVKTKAGNLLLLLQSYRLKNATDTAIAGKLEINQNSFYVLKSRLYDKIQQRLSGGIATHENVIRQLLQVEEMYTSQPRETAIAFLQKLETELLHYDMHNELQVIYSTLKKIHLHSDKYFHYSQLFNKQVAFGLNMEKAEEVLGNFNVILGKYDFSRSLQELEALKFLKKEIVNMQLMNPSRQIEIIKNMIELQLIIFCFENKSFEYSTSELIQKTRQLLDSLPEIASQKKWELPLDYLCFEYYLSIGEYKMGIQYYEKVNAQVSTFLLLNNICLNSKFLSSKIKFCYEMDRLDELTDAPVLYDHNDFHSIVSLSIYNAMVLFRQQNYKKAIQCLNETLNVHSFKDYFHQSINVKLSLAYFYLITGEFEMMEIITKSVSRKIKDEKLESYKHVLHLIKIFELEVKHGSKGKINPKVADLFTLFLSNNNKTHEVLPHLVHILRKKYQS